MPDVGEVILPQFDKRAKQWRVARRRGRVFDVEGRLIELFPLRVLASTIKKTTHTVRVWERKGMFPRPMYILSFENGQASRWYSKVQIANIRVAYRRHNNQKKRREFLEEVWKVFYKTELLPEAVKGDVL